MTDANALDRLFNGPGIAHRPVAIKHEEGFTLLLSNLREFTGGVGLASHHGGGLNRGP